MLAVPADASKGLGMFDALNGFEDAAALSDALKARVRNCCWTELTHHQRGTPFSVGTPGVSAQIKRCSGLKATRYVAFSICGTPGTPFFEGYRF